MRRLAVGQTPELIDPAFQQMYEQGRPGFQIGPEVTAEECLGILQAHMRTRLGIEDFTFNVAFGTERVTDVPGIVHSYLKEGTSDGKAHIDEPQARRNLGIVMHENRSGVGSVVLQLARYGVTDIPIDEANGRIDRSLVAGHKYEGTLLPGVKTIFSEGLVGVGGLIAVRLGPAIHDFRSKGDDRAWVRYGWEPLASVR